MMLKGYGLVANATIVLGLAAPAYFLWEMKQIRDKSIQIKDEDTIGRLMKEISEGKLPNTNENKNSGGVKPASLNIDGKPHIPPDI